MQAILSHYRILEKIGAGGMGVVYRSHDERLDRDVALKVLPEGLLGDETARRRFRKEALALSKINHPNIAVVHDFDTQEGTDFLVEELIEGISLSEMVSTGPCSEREIVDLGTQLCEGLAAAHEHGVIHCDLKPANVRITPDARVKILDFGLAKVLRTTQAALDWEATASVTRQSASGGTLPYMSPEQLLSEKVDARTDIWAAGCVLYEMATGLRPFSGSATALTDAILHSAPASITKLNPKAPNALDVIIGKCLDKDSSRRYSSAREIAVDLRRLTSGRNALSLRMSRSLRKPLGKATVVTAVLLALAAYASLRRPGGAPAGHERRAAAVAAPAAHDSYLRGLEQLERWDKAKNIDTAIVNFQQAIRADPSYALGFSALGEAYWRKYRRDHNSNWIEQAEANCRRAAELNSQLPAVYVTLALLHNGEGRYNLALQEIQQALKLAPRDGDALLGEATVYASLGRVEEAESKYKKAVALRPQHWGGQYELGVFYFRQKRYADAAVEFRRVIELTPDNVMAHATLGAMMQLLHRNEEAETELKRSLELEPSYAAYTNLGALYYRQRRWADSADMTENALKINATDYKAWANLGMAYGWLNQKDKAEAAFRQELAQVEKIVKISADDAEVQSELGLLYSRQKQREKAIPRIEAALALAPNDPSTLADTAESYENLGERNRALRFIGQALARGWTVAQMENNPALRNLVRDPRFRRMVTGTQRSSSAQRQ